MNFLIINNCVYNKIQDKKGKGKQTLEDEDDDDDDDDEEDEDDDNDLHGGKFVWIKVNHYVNDGSAAPDPLSKAIFGFARVDLLKPLLPIIHGEFNKRPLNQKALDQLVQNMEAEGVHSDLYETAIPLLANPDDIDPSSIVKDVSKISQAPDLKLSAKGKGRVDRFYAAGGNHRTEAVREFKKRLTKRVDGFKAKLKTNGQSQDLVEKIREGEDKIARVSNWTVILYDESKSILIDWKWTYFLI